MRVIVGSTNPVKINAVKEAFEKMFPDTSWEISGVKIDSGVSEQPMSDEESIRGATNRAKKSLHEEKADFGVGLEGGIQKIGNEHIVSGWAVVISKNGDRGIGSSIGMRVPEKIIALIKNGQELGDAIDVTFKGENLKQKEGFFGIMTNNAITRTHGYRDGTIAALTPFLHPEVFEK